MSLTCRELSDLAYVVAKLADLAENAECRVGGRCNYEATIDAIAIDLHRLAARCHDEWIEAVRRGDP